MNYVDLLETISKALLNKQAAVSETISVGSATLSVAAKIDYANSTAAVFSVDCSDSSASITDWQDFIGLSLSSTTNLIGCNDIKIEWFEIVFDLVKFERVSTTFQLTFSASRIGPYKINSLSLLLTIDSDSKISSNISCQCDAFNLSNTAENPSLTFTALDKLNLGTLASSFMGGEKLNLPNFPDNLEDLTVIASFSSNPSVAVSAYSGEKWELFGEVIEIELGELQIGYSESEGVSALLNGTAAVSNLEGCNFAFVGSYPPVDVKFGGTISRIVFRDLAKALASNNPFTNEWSGVLPSFSLENPAMIVEVGEANIFGAIVKSVEVSGENWGSLVFAFTSDPTLSLGFAPPDSWSPLSLFGKGAGIEKALLGIDLTQVGVTLVVGSTVPSWPNPVDFGLAVTLPAAFSKTPRPGIEIAGILSFTGCGWGAVAQQLCALPTEGVDFTLAFNPDPGVGGSFLAMTAAVDPFNGANLNSKSKSHITTRKSNLVFQVTEDDFAVGFQLDLSIPVHNSNPILCSGELDLLFGASSGLQGKVQLENDWINPLGLNGVKALAGAQITVGCIDLIPVFGLLGELSTENGISGGIGFLLDSAAPEKNFIATNIDDTNLGKVAELIFAKSPFAGFDKMFRQISVLGEWDASLSSNNAIVDQLNNGKLPSPVESLIAKQGDTVNGQVDISSTKKDEWLVFARSSKLAYRLSLDGASIKVVKNAHLVISPVKMDVGGTLKICGNEYRGNFEFDVLNPRLIAKGLIKKPIRINKHLEFIGTKGVGPSVDCEMGSGTANRFILDAGIETAWVSIPGKLALSDSGLYFHVGTEANHSVGGYKADFTIKSELGNFDSAEFSVQVNLDIPNNSDIEKEIMSQLTDAEKLLLFGPLYKGTPFKLTYLYFSLLISARKGIQVSLKTDARYTNTITGDHDFSKDSIRIKSETPKEAIDEVKKDIINWLQGKK